MAEVGRWNWEQTALAAEALSMLMDGIDLRGAKMRPWYERE